MLVLGLHVATQGNKRVIRGVLLDPTNDSVLSPPIEHLPDRGHDEATQVREARDAVASALRAHEIAAAVLREADYHFRRGVTDGTKRRLRLEGVCLAACREKTSLVEVMDGPALGRACGGNKDAAFDAARILGVSENLVEATAAALAAKSLLSVA
ncbi:MAG: hypothetical protein ACRDTK_00535 [Mycobacterium sp.]